MCSTILLFNTNFTSRSVRENLSAIWVLAENATILVRHRAHVIFANKHTCLSQSISFGCTRNWLQIFGLFVAEHPASTLIVRDDPFAALLAEGRPDTIREHHLCVSISQLSHHDTLFCDKTGKFAIFVIFLGLVARLNYLAIGSVLHD